LLRAEFSEAALAVTSVETLDPLLLRTLMKGLDAQLGWVVSVEQERGVARARIRAEHGSLEGLKLSPGGWLAPSQRVLREGAAQIFDPADPSTAPLPDPLSGALVGSALALPLGRAGQGGAVAWLLSQERSLACESAVTFGTQIGRLAAAAFGRLAREQSLLRLRQYVDLLPDGVLVMRADGRLLDANETALGFYGHTHEELLELSILDLRGSATLPEVLWQMRQADRSGLMFETVHRRKDGSQFRCEVRSRGAVLEGEHVLISVIRPLPDPA
jgi:PAS domain S-box-containing protein